MIAIYANGIAYTKPVLMFASAKGAKNLPRRLKRKVFNPPYLLNQAYTP